MGLKLIHVLEGRVVIESDLEDYPMAITELKSQAAKEFAIISATKHGLQGAATSGVGQPYPVDDNGKEIIHGQKGKIHHYRIDIPVAGAVGSTFPAATG